jgi:sugar phosphate isomerase/epimerase
VVRFAHCNEMLEGQPVAEHFEWFASRRYAGVEVAPFTVAPTADLILPERRRGLAEAAAGAGVEITGLHWLLAGPASAVEGWHLTAPDVNVRSRTAAYLGELARLCADLGGHVLVLGSPKQRSTVDGLTVREATGNLIHALRLAMPAVADVGVTLCLEPLPLAETDVVTTCDEALAVIHAVDHPSLRLVIDVKSLVAEFRQTGEPVPTIIRRVGREVAYVQANDENRGHPGSGSTDFVPICQAIRDVSYDGWISMEPFEFGPGADTVAREGLACLERAWADSAPNRTTYGST